MRKDNAYLNDILDAINDIENFLKGLSSKQFKENKEKLYAVIRCLEIIGEASKAVSKEIRLNYPDVPWKEIAGMRDKFIHILV